MRALPQTRLDRRIGGGIIMRPILKDIERSDELMYVLGNISSDDQCEISDYTDAELIHEAKYVLSCFYEGGHDNNDALTDPSNEAHNWAMKNVRELKKLIAKYN
jgi:hypothetical protein